MNFYFFLIVVHKCAISACNVCGGVAKKIHVAVVCTCQAGDAIDEKNKRPKKREGVYNKPRDPKCTGSTVRKFIKGW